MADNNILRVGAEFDVSNIVAGANTASTAFEGMGAKIAQVSTTAAAGASSIDSLATKLRQQGLTAQETASALVNLGYSQEEASAATQAATSTAEGQVAALRMVSESAEQATQSMTRLRGGAAMARVELGALSGSTGAVEFGLARLAGQSATLAPLISAAFLPLSVVAFGEIIYHVGEKIYHVYQNVVLLKGAIEALDKASESEASKAASLNYEYEQGLARRLEAQNRLTEASREYQKAAADKPLELPKIDDKNFKKQFNADFVSFMQAVHAQTDAPNVITRINAELQSTQQQLDAAKAKLADTVQLGGTNVVPPPVFKRYEADVEDLTKKLGFLQTAIGQVQSQTGIEANALSDSLEAVAKKGAEEAQKAAAQQLKIAREKAQAIAKLHQDLQKVSIPDSESGLYDQTGLPSETLFQNAAQKLADEVGEGWRKVQEENARGAQEAAKAALDVQTKGLEDEAKLVSERERAITEGYKRDLEDRSASWRTYIAEVTASAQQEYQEQLAAAAREEQLDRQAADAHVITAEELAKRLAAIDNHIAEQHVQMWNKILQADQQAVARERQQINQLAQQWGQDWTRMANEVLQSREKIGNALKQMAAEMELQLIDRGIQLVVQKTAAMLLQLLASHVQFLAQLMGIEAAGAAEKLAKDKMTAAAEIQTQAGVAGAEAYASGLASAPFPANLAIAAAAMAGAISTVESNLAYVGAFERGGVVPATGFALVHEGEGVLTAQQMAAIHNSNTTNNTVSRGPMRVENHFNLSPSEMSHDGIVAAVNEGIRRGQIKGRL